MNILKRLSLTVLILMLCIALSPLVLLMLAVATWRTAGILQQYPTRQALHSRPIEGTFRREVGAHYE